MKKKIWKFLKYFLITIGSVLILIVVAIYSLQFPAVQNFVKDKLVQFLEDKIKTKVSLDRIYVHFPNKIELENLYLQGEDVDTLLYVNHLNVGLNLPELLNSKAEFTSIQLDGLTANVIKRADSTFNFNYIIDAFASKENVKQEESKPFLINLDKIRLQNLNVSYQDVNSKNDISVALKDFETVVKTFDLENNSYAVDFINADGLKLFFNQGLLEEVSDNIEKTVDSISQGNALSVAVRRLNLQNFDVLYDDENSATKAKVLFKELKSEIRKIDLQKSDFQIDDLYFKDAFVDVLLTPNSDAAKAVEQISTESSKSTETSENALNVLLNKGILENINVVYNNGVGTNKAQSFNSNHLNIKNLNGAFNDISFGNEISGAVEKLSFVENSGFVLQNLTTKFKYGTKETILENLNLKTPYTFLQRNLKLSYNSIDDLSNKLGSVEIEAKLPQTKIGFKDILWLAPNLKTTVPFNKYPNAVLNMSADVKGTVNNLLVQEFKLSGLDNLNVSASGTLKNVLNTDKLVLNLKVNDLTANKKLITNLVPKNTIPNTIEIPNHLSVSGKFKGSLKDIYVDLGLQSSFGNAKILGSLNQAIKNAEKYDLNASLANFNVGKLLKQKDIGIVTATAKIKGTGFNFEKNHATVDAFVKQATFQKYTYQNVKLKGDLNEGNYSVTLNSDDENAKINIVASGIYNAKQPTIKTEGTVFKLDLNKLGFSESPMAFAGKLNADFSSLNPDALNGTLLLQDFVMSNGEEIYPISEVSLAAVSTDSINSMELRSQVADLTLTGKYKLTEISTSFLHTLNQYYHFQKNSIETAIEPHQFFDFRAKVKNDDLIRKFAPELKKFETINLYGSYNADLKNVTMYGSIPNVEYGAFILNDIKLSAGNDEEQLNYALTLNEFNSEQFRLANIALTGFVANDLIDYNLQVLNDKEEVQYKIAGNVATANQLIDITLKQDGLVLNYAPWNVTEDNKLTIHPKGIVANNLQLFNNASSILINSEGTTPDAPLNVAFKDFKIETLTEIIRKDSLLAEGTINGEAHIKDLMSDLRLTADLNIKDLKVFGNAIGTINANVANETASLYKANVQLTGFNNNLSLIGSYDLTASSFDANVDIKALQMTSIQGFSMNQLRDAKGYISGDLKVSGTTTNPNILGQLKFNNAGFGITQLNTTFQDMNDAINFTNRGIEFQDFKIKDTEANALTINGAVLTQTYRDFIFNLNLTARDFKVVNSTKSDNQILYGVMAINADLGIKGDLNLPKVDGQITVTDKTDFTFVMPQSSPALQDREGIIEFVDQDQLALQETLKDTEEVLEETIKGYDVNLNIEVENEAKLSIVIDKTNGDFIKLQGEAQLTGGIDPSGKTTLTGRYEVKEGAYEMSVSLLKRKFNIQEGSTIIWTGEPTKADVNITAIYKTKAAPIDLLQQQITAEDVVQQNKYKQQIPLNTKLMMTGELLKPVIKFDIEVDGNNPTIEQTIIDATEDKFEQLRAEESEMNKQVFALLLLNRFIGENPFASSTGISAETMARQSVSRMLSQQLNNLAADLIEGVELNFDLESNDDYTTGTKDTRTDLNVGVSKRLLNDRLKVSIGSNFGLEGNERQNERMTNIAGNIQVDYMLSKDGRYLLKAYRKDEYQMALQGQVVETGVGFVITVEYNQFKELLRRRKVNREFRKMQRTDQTQQNGTETK